MPPVKTNYAARTYDITWRGANLGTTVPGSVNIPIEARVIDVESDQIEGRADSIPKGVIFGDDLTMELQSADMESIIGNLLRDQVEVIINGIAQSAGLGFKTRRSEDVAGQLRYHPTGVDPFDTVNDIIAHLAFPNVDLTLTGERDQEQRLAVTFTTLPDGNQALGFQYGRLGSPFIVAATPEFVSFQMDQNINRVPYMSLRAGSLSPGEIQRLAVTATFMTAGLVTADIDNGPGYLATDTDLVFDNLSSAQAFQEGDFIKIGTEVLFISTAPVYTTDFAGTITVVRGVPSGTGLAIIDGVQITLQTGVSSRFVREAATLVSSVPANIVVGNTFAGSGVAAKGIISDGGAAGASNIKATVNAVDSDDLVYTRT